MSRRASRSKSSGPASFPVERGSTGRAFPDDGDTAIILGERLRRYALGLTAALLTARAYWPSEPDVRNGAGSGLSWIMLLLFAAGLGIVAAVVDGRFRIRMSWTELAVIVLVGLVGLSATHAVDRRPAINLAWEWIGIGIAYLLVRNLPRNRDESGALAGALAATAVAVSVYGLYQERVEYPALRAAFHRDPVAMMKQAEVTPGGMSEARFRDRLLGSNEVMSTFGLANSLAGFLVGPLVMIVGVVLRNLAKKNGRGSLLFALGMAALPTLVVAICLAWTKSRSASIGLIAGMAVLLWRMRRDVSRKFLIISCTVGVVISLLVVAAGLKSGHLDLLVFTQTPKSMRVRLEYWQATWDLILNGAASIGKALGSTTLWFGVGPGNFGPAYLLHKLPQASEEIQDPHNMVLEVWAASGFLAMAALLAALGFGLWYSLRTVRADVPDDPEGSKSSGDSAVRWVIVGSGFGWALVVVLGQLNPFAEDLFARWLILGASWLAAVFLGKPLWTRIPVPAAAMGAGALAIAVNLLAAGGIGIPTVALCLWSMLAVGQNLREDRPCGELRTVGARTAGITVLGIWTAILGAFLGAVIPFWNSEAAIASADAALDSPAGPNFEGAEAALLAAIKADPYNSRPWRKLAGLKLSEWQERGAKPDDLRWKTIPYTLLNAVSYPRNPNVWSLHAEQAAIMTTILSRVGPNLTETDRIRYLGDIVRAWRTASRLYPTNATLHAELAAASANISMYADAVAEAAEALRLDKVLAPHPDKQLTDPMRKQLQDQLPTWKERAEAMPVGIQP